MRIPPPLKSEDERLAALYQYDALGGATLAGLDDVVALAARLFDVPIALVSLVDRHVQVFAAKVGIDACSTDRDVSFCAHALAAGDVLVVPDATLDPRFVSNPLVTGPPHIRFYAGAPLRAPSGHLIGTLCIIDRQARRGLSERDRSSLLSLAALVIDKLEIQRLSVAARSGQERFRNVAATSPDAIVCADHLGHITFWNGTAERLFGYSAATAIGRSIDLIVPESMRGSHGGGLKRVAAGGKPVLVGKTVELDAEDASGRTFPIELSLSMWREDGQASFGAIMRDITERRASEDRLFQLAHLDALTGLPNRNVLVDRLDTAVTANAPVALMLLDLDGFKSVNDGLGHRAGDDVLREVARRVLGCVQQVDTVARLGGDEFGVLLDKRDGQARASRVADAIIAAMSAPFGIDDQSVHIGVSIGIATFPGAGAQPNELLSNADLAMYQAKREGRNCSRTFSPRLREEALNRRAYEGELRRAVVEEEFVLHYQPQIDLASGQVTGAEALLRWQHPTRGVLAPAAFLTALEGGMMAVEVGDWVLETACAQGASWLRRAPGFRIAVNLFEAQFRAGDLSAKVAGALRRTGLPAAALELEVTENTILRHDETMLEALRELHAQRVSIAFDDFGTGFASLSMLKLYPLSGLKIDRSFIEDIESDTADAVIVNAIVALGRGLGLEVVAEGVETEGQRDMLHASGCGRAQGYLFGRPMPADAFERWMSANLAAHAPLALVGNG